MGTWGPSLYADDTALDLRAEWRSRIRWGSKPDAATEQLRKQFGYDETTFWLVLADLQWQSGRVVPIVRDRALKILASGVDLERWKGAEPKDQRTRAAVLRRLRDRLESDPPPPTIYNPPRGAKTPMKIGEVYSWRLLDGRFAFFQVCGMCKNCGASPAPSVRVFDVVSERVLSLDELACTPSRKAIKRFERTEAVEPTFREHPQVAFGIYGPGQYPRARLKRLGRLLVPSVLDDDRKVIGSSWLGADRLFPIVYGIGWVVGDIVAWKTDGAPVVLSICEIDTIREGAVTWPYLTVEILDWSGPGLPATSDLSKLVPRPIRERRWSIRGLPPRERFEYLGRVSREPVEGHSNGVVRWTSFDSILARAL